MPGQTVLGTASVAGLVAGTARLLGGDDVATQNLWIGEDLSVEFLGAADATDGSYLNTATVTYALKDEDGATVAGGTGTLSYVAASNGNYRGTVESTVTTLLTDNAVYFLEITGSQPSYNWFRRLRAKARYRSET